MSRCWTCRKRRLKCDGGVPHCQKCWGHGVKCLGYQKPLTWVQGVARRGPMKNRNYGDSQQQPAPFEDFPPRGVELMIASSVPMTLTEPLLQGRDSTCRFFVDYFSHRVCPALVFKDLPGNPYRGIIQCIASPAVASALVTVAVCHYIQSLTGRPLAGLSLPTTNPSMAQTKAAGQDVYQDATLKFYLHCKSKTLTLISAALADDQSAQGGKATLIAVLLLMILDVFESGSGAWSLHLEGAKTLLDSGVLDGSSEWDTSAGALLHETAIFQTFGSSLAKPGALASGSTLPVTSATKDRTITPIGCPVDILSAVEVFASHRRVDGILATPQTVNMGELEATLQLIRSYDISDWATSTAMVSSAVPFDDLLHLGTIWKLAAEIYACCVLRTSSTNATLALEQPSVQALISQYTFFERNADEIIKCLIWPTFVAGAVSTSPEERAWVLRTLDRIWTLGRCANTQSAAEALEVLWEKRDCTESSEDDDPAAWDWIGELSRLKGSWLFV